MACGDQDYATGMQHGGVRTFGWLVGMGVLVCPDELRDFRPVGMGLHDVVCDGRNLMQNDGFAPEGVKLKRVTGGTWWKAVDRLSVGRDDAPERAPEHPNYRYQVIGEGTV